MVLVFGFGMILTEQNPFHRGLSTSVQSVFYLENICIEDTKNLFKRNNHWGQYKQYQRFQGVSGQVSREGAPLENF